MDNEEPKTDEEPENVTDTETDKQVDTIPLPLQGPVLSDFEGGGQAGPEQGRGEGVGAIESDNLAGKNPDLPAPSAPAEADTNSELPAGPAPGDLADTPAAPADTNTPPDPDPAQSRSSQESVSPAKSQESQQSQTSQPACPPCPACPEPSRGEELTIDSPAFKDLLRIYMSTFLLARRSKREQRLQLILDSYGPLDKITNDQVEKLLKVSDRTATAYLTALFKRGKLMRFGKGHRIFYQKISQ